MKNSWHILENSNANCKILIKLLKQKKKKKFVNVHKIVFENSKQTVVTLPDNRTKKAKKKKKKKKEFYLKYFNKIIIICK